MLIDSSGAVVEPVVGAIMRLLASLPTDERRGLLQMLLAAELSA